MRSIRTHSFKRLIWSGLIASISIPHKPLFLLHRKSRHRKVVEMLSQVIESSLPAFSACLDFMPQWYEALPFLLAKQ